MKPFRFVSENERRQFQEFRDKVLADDWTDPPKPKLRCRLFGHRWFIHRLEPGSRTICDWCKINQDVYISQKNEKR